MPDTGARSAATCRNCDTELSGHYCHACGQQVRGEVGLRTLAGRTLASIATPGGRFFETLTGLIASPGALTRTYNGGARARFVSPWAMLLFAMLVLHGVQWAAGGGDGAISHEQSVNRALDRARSSLDAYAADEAGAERQGTALLQDQSTQARSSLSAEERRERALSTQFFTDQAIKAWNPVEASEEKSAGWEALLSAALAAVPALFPVIGWLLIPALLPMMSALLRSHKEAGAIGHAHFLAYMTAAVALALAAGTALVWAGVPAVFAVPAIGALVTAHTAVHVRGAFDLSWPGSAWRTAAIVLSALFILTLVSAGLTTAGFAD